jgi:hypothetical protein
MGKTSSNVRVLPSRTIANKIQCGILRPNTEIKEEIIKARNKSSPVVWNYKTKQ